MAERKTDHLRIRYGICLNDECSMCKSKNNGKEIIQEIPSRKDFVCEKCGKPLRECPPPKKSNIGKLIAIVAAAVVILGGAGYGIYAWSNSNDQSVEEPIGEPSPQIPEVVKPDTTATSPVVKPDTTIVTNPVATTDTPVKQKGPSVSWGKYTGPENGRGGEIKVTKAFSLVLDKIKGTTLELKPGDSIEETKFVDGELRQGVWVHKGTRQFFTR